MAYITYRDEEEVPEDERISDRDNIIQIHRINSPVMRQHYELYRQLMYGKSPLSRIQREMIAVVVSAKNNCHY